MNLACINFVACGENHSLAITSHSSDPEDSLALYSWGWSCYGQLGNAKVKNSINLQKPHKVVFPEGPINVA
jgi:alpha-tubulin suppressor-like RCC1 family protein